MTRRAVQLLLAAACFTAAPVAPPIPVGPPPAASQQSDAGPLPTDAEFAALLKSDPVRAFRAVLKRYENGAPRYTCVMQKQERLAGTLGPIETVEVACRERPLAVLLSWQGSVGIGKPVKTLYVRDENGGKTKVRTRLITLDLDPNGHQSRTAARYSIEDFGFLRTTERTVKAWGAARDRGALNAEYLGTRAVPECGGRVCHVVRRTCTPPEVDSFALDDPPPDPAKHPKDAFTTVTLMFDAETWLQVGSVMEQPGVGLVGAYYFRGVKLDPAFGPEQFTPAALRR